MMTLVRLLAFFLCIIAAQTARAQTFIPLPPCAADGLHALTNPGSVPTCTSFSAGSGSVAAGSGGLVPTAGSPATLFVEQMNPGGRLTVASGVCTPNTDQVAQTTLYYAPCTSQWVPIYDGTNMELHQFTSSATDTVGLSIALGSNWAALTLYDAYVGLNSSVVTLCTGPAWTATNVGSPGTSVRGTGAGTSELQLFKGFWTNKNSMTCRYGNATTFTCGVNQCTYVGTIFTHTVAGQIDLQFGTFAANCGQGLLSIWNQYNRKMTRATTADTTGSWTYSSTTWRPIHGSANCNVAIVVGMPDESFTAQHYDLVASAAGGSASYIGIGFNASNVPATREYSASAIMAVSTDSTLNARWEDVPVLGINIIYAIEKGDGVNANTFFGQNAPTNIEAFFVGGLM